MTGKFEKVFYLLLAIAGALYLFAAFQYSAGEAMNPGPGMMPRILGVIFLVMSGCLLVMGWFSHKSNEEKPNRKVGHAERRYTILWVVMILIAYTAAMDLIGFATGSFLAILGLGKVMGLEGWIRPIILSIVVAACSQFLFGFVLDVPLPRGEIFGG